MILAYSEYDVFKSLIFTSHTTVANIHLPIAIIKKQFYSELPVNI